MKSVKQLLARRGSPKTPAMLEDGASGSSVVVWLAAATLVALVAWMQLFELDEVSSGTGKVIPTSREQVIQSLEGGILKELNVQEGDIVQSGQVLAQLDPTRIESSVQESEARTAAAQATAVRLQAEVSGAALNFPRNFAKQYPDLVRAETALYRSRRDSLAQTLDGLEEALALVRKELKLTESLRTMGAASEVEVLRLRRQANELQTKIADTRSQYIVRAREELAKSNAEVEAQQSVVRGRADSLERLTLTSPVKGVVKDIEVNTVGGVIPPNGKLMSIVPLDDQLLVEARIAPRDVAFIHPGQRATVKITAYDYAIYGALEGQVTTISPDTIQDEVKRDEYYYRVYVRTSTDALVNKAGKSFPIFPGMIATVDVHTGSKTIWSYLTKPLNRAAEALRER